VSAAVFGRIGSMAMARAQACARFCMIDASRLPAALKQIRAPEAPAIDHVTAITV